MDGEQRRWSQQGLIVEQNLFYDLMDTAPAA